MTATPRVSPTDDTDLRGRRRSFERHLAADCRTVADAPPADLRLRAGIDPRLVSWIRFRCGGCVIAWRSGRALFRALMMPITNPPRRPGDT
jgi:hypothetical protein